MCGRAEHGFLSGLSSSDSDNLVLGTSKIKPIKVTRSVRKIGSPTDGSETFVRDSIPRLLLRPVYENAKELPQYSLSEDEWNRGYYFALCSMDETERAISSKLISLKEDTDIMAFQGPAIYGFPRDVVEHVMVRDYHTVINALLFRLRISHNAMDRCRENGDRKNEFRWQLLIDTHIDLASYMLKYECYDDEQLLDPKNNKTSPLRSARDQYEPHDTRFYYWGELPDLTGCLDMGNLWYNIKPKFSGIVSAIIHVLVCKPQHQKCQFRNFMRIMLRYFEQYPAIFETFRLIAQVSLLGNYDHARFRPLFSKRVDIVSSFDRNILSYKKLCLWFIENEQLVYYMAKEFNANTVVQQHALNITLEKTGPWAKVREIVFNAMDTVRSMFSRSEEENIFLPINIELKRINDESLIYLSKLRKDGFLKILLSELNKYKEKKLGKRIDSDSLDILERVITDQNVIDAMHLCAKVVARRLDNKIETMWLKCFGISETGYELFRNLYYAYERLDIADNAISKKLDEIFSNNEKDFHVIRHYLRLIYDYRSTREYTLTADYYRNCLTALRTKLQLLPWESLPDDADVFYYCSTCRNWSCPVVDDGSVNGSLNIYARGFEKALYDHVDGKLYCGKPPSTNTNRKSQAANKANSEFNIPLSSSQSSLKMNELLSGSTIKRGMNRKRNAPACKDTPLTPVHMLGKAKRLDGRLWVMCETCASIIEFECAKFNLQGHTCSFHRRDFIASQTAEIGACAGSTDELENLRIKFGLNSACIAERCWYCNLTREQITRTQNGIQPITVSLLNDDGTNLKVETVLMCMQDYGSAHDLFSTNDIVRRSSAHALISARRLQRALPSRLRTITQ